MLLPISIKRIQIHLARFGVFSNTFPVSWNKKQKRFQVSRKHYRRFRFVNTLMLSSFLYIGFRLVQIHFKKLEISHLEMLKLWLVFFFNFNGIVMLTHFGNHAETVAKLGNDFSELEKQIEDLYVDSWDPNCFKRVEQFIKLYGCLCFLMPISQILDFLLNPCSFVYPTSFLLGSANYWFQILVYSYVQGTLAFATCFSCALPIAIAVPMASFTHEIIQELKLSSRQKRYRTYPQIRTPQMLSHYYKSLCLLYELANEISGSLLMPMFSTHSYVIIWLIYVLIKKSGHLDPSLLFMLILIVYGTTSGWIVILHLSGSTFKKTTGCLVSWKRNSLHRAHNLKLLKKISSSCKPIGLRFGSFYIVRLVRVLKFIHFLIWGTVRALVIF